MKTYPQTAEQAQSMNSTIVLADEMIKAAIEDLSAIARRDPGVDITYRYECADDLLFHARTALRNVAFDYHEIGFDHVMGFPVTAKVVIDPVAEQLCSVVSEVSSQLKIISAEEAIGRLHVAINHPDVLAAVYEDVAESDQVFETESLGL